VRLAAVLWAPILAFLGPFRSLAQSTVQQPPAAHVADSPAPATESLNRLEGLPVAEIHISSPAIQHPAWLEPLVEQKAHEPLDKRKVRQSVQALFNTGRFSEIQVEAQRNPRGEIVLTFNGRENFFFGSIRVEGAPTPLNNTQLVNASKLTLGDQFTEEKVTAGIAGMQHVLQENGYYRAVIQPFYEWDTENQQLRIAFVVNHGPRARVGHITVTGSPGYDVYQILEISKLHPGDTVSTGQTTRALQHLRKKFQKSNRLEAQVSITQRVYHPETNALDYTFDIVRGPLVTIKVEGASLRKGLIKRYVPIYEENAVDSDLLNEGKNKIRDYFQTKGFFDTQVDAVEKDNPAADRTDVTFHVDQGKRHKLLEITLDGNKYFPRETIRERMTMQPAGGLLLYGLYSQTILGRDVSSIEDLYHANGFLQAKVSPNVQDDYLGKVGQIKVTLKIDEGPQTLVGKLTIQGNSAVPSDTLRGLISATEGQPYSETSIANDQSLVTNYYFNHGFPEIRFASSVKPEPGAANRMDVSYKLTEGDQVFVDKVLISGLHYTKGFIVEREMAVQSGDPLSQEDMLDSQRRLYDLGIFNAVEMAVQNPEGEATHKNVTYQVTEAQRYTFTYGVGFEVATGQPSASTAPQGDTGASARVSFDVTRLNFRGRDHTITLQTRYGNLQKRALVSYQAPRWFDYKNLTMSLTAFYDDTFDVRTFEARRLEGSAEIKQTLNKGTTLFYRFTYRRVDIPENSLVIDPNLVPLFSQPVRVGMPALTYIRDTRDDPTDSHKGAFTSLDGGAASGYFGSQANFSRFLAQNSTYYQFHKKRWVFARSTRIGFEEPFSSTDFIPLPERFFAGGSNSLRGFGINQAGPRDLQTGFPLGGQAIFLNNLELRTPPLPLPLVGNDVSAVVFHDMGNVFSSAGDIVDSLLRHSQPHPSSCTDLAVLDCNFNYVSHAVGGGVRYRTPIGPVSFDLGYNLNPPAFPVARENRVDQLKHFNFFFSIGQTF
jgi:outer membrane protein assembly complex protein YaeT